MSSELLNLAQACTPYDCLENLEFDWHAWHRRWSRFVSLKNTSNSKKFKTLSQALEDYWSTCITRQFFTHVDAFKLCKPCTMPDEGRKDSDNCIRCQKDLMVESFGRWNSLAISTLEGNC